MAMRADAPNFVPALHHHADSSRPLRIHKDSDAAVHKKEHPGLSFSQIEAQLMKGCGQAMAAGHNRLSQPQPARETLHLQQQIPRAPSQPPAVSVAPGYQRLRPNGLFCPWCTTGRHCAFHAHAGAHSLIGWTQMRLPADAPRPLKVEEMVDDDDDVSTDVEGTHSSLCVVGSDGSENEDKLDDAISSITSGYRAPTAPPPPPPGCAPPPPPHGRPQRKG